MKKGYGNVVVILPKRLIDGEALWKSDKLNKVQPESYRAEYANLVPLALADGTFECNARRIWSEVYSYNRPSVTVEIVQSIITEFERVGLLALKKDGAGKIWGKWTGIEKHLPPPSLQVRYKEGNSHLFSNIRSINNDSTAGQDDVLLGLGLDKDRIRIGTTADWKTLRLKYRNIFGVGHADNKKSKEEFERACQEYTFEVVLEEFEPWALSEGQWIKNSRNPQFGLSQYYKVLPEILASRDNVKATSAALDLTRQEERNLAVQATAADDAKLEQERVERESRDSLARDVIKKLQEEGI